jgi:hypothetical protein
MGLFPSYEYLALFVGLLVLPPEEAVTLNAVDIRDDMYASHEDPAYGCRDTGVGED